MPSLLGGILLFNGSIDFFMVGKAPLGFLGINQAPVNFHFKNPTPGTYQLHRQVEFSLDGIRQTGGTGLVVSNLAILNGDGHGCSL